MTYSAHCPICSSAEYRREVALAGGNAIVRCLSCGTGFLLPRPDQASLVALHSSDDYFAHPYFESRRSLTSALKAIYSRRRRLLERTSGNPLTGRRVLDVGCDTGAFMQYLNESTGAACLGIDVFPRVVDAARKAGLEVYCGTLESCALPDKSVDAVCAFDLIEHVDHPERFLSEAFRVIRPGGIVVLETPNFDGLVYRLGRWLGRMGLFPGLLAPLHARLWPVFHVQYFTRHSIEGMLRTAGFDTISVTRRELESHELAVSNPVLRAATLAVFSIARAVGDGSLLVVTGRKSGQPAPVRNFAPHIPSIRSGISGG